MSCPKCNNTLVDGFYKCSETDYIIIDLQNNLIFINEWKQLS